MHSSRLPSPATFFELPLHIRARCKVRSSTHGRFVRTLVFRPTRGKRSLPAQPTRCCPCKATVTHPNWPPDSPTVAAFVRWNFLFPPANRGEISRPEYCKRWGSYAPPAHCAHRNDAIASSSLGSAAPAARKSPTAASAFSKVIHSV